MTGCRLAFGIGAALAGCTPALAEITPIWNTRIPVGSSLYAGLRGFKVDAAGIVFLTAGTGDSNNADILTARIDPDGTLIWSSIYDSDSHRHDTTADLALATDGSVLVGGSTTGANFFADALLLRYEPALGALVKASTYDGGSGISDGGTRVAADVLNNAYVGGMTVGDGSDCLTVKFNSAGTRQWSKVWDGPAFAPFSQEAVRNLAIDPAGNVIMVTGAVMANNHADYQVLKYNAASGAILWSKSYGLGGDDYPAETVIDAAGDVYVTGVGLDFTDKYLTVKFSGTDGAVRWTAYDFSGIDDAASAIWVDNAGGVYVTGAVDHDGDRSNFNDNIYTVKRDATTGDLLWTHEYGANCVGCYDVPGDLVVDSAGHVIVDGSTSSPPYLNDLILLILDAQTGVETARAIVHPGQNEGSVAGFMRLDEAENIHVGGNAQNFNTGETDVSVLKFASLAPKPGDADGDGDVDLSDLGIVLASFGACSGEVGFDSRADLNADQCVDLSDLGIVLANFGS